MDRIEIEERRGVEYVDRLDMAEAMERGAEYVEALATQVGALLGLDAERVARALADGEAVQSVVEASGAWRSDVRLRAAQVADELVRPRVGWLAVSADASDPCTWREARREAARLARWADRTTAERIEALSWAAGEHLRRSVAGVACGFLQAEDVAFLSRVAALAPGLGALGLLVRHQGFRALVTLGALPTWVATCDALASYLPGALAGLGVRDVSLTAADAEAVRS